MRSEYCQRILSFPIRHCIAVADYPILYVNSFLHRHHPVSGTTTTFGYGMQSYLIDSSAYIAHKSSTIIIRASSEATYERAIAMTRELPQPCIDAVELLRAVRVHNRPRLEALLQPLGDMAAQTRSFLLEGVNLLMRFVGVQLLAQELRNQGETITSTEIARELFRALEHDPTFVHGGQAERHMVNNVLDLLVFTLSESGCYRELILEYQRWLAVAERTAIDPYFATRLRLELVEALFHVGDYERAIGVLEEARARGIDSSQVIAEERLERKLQDFYGRVDEAKPEARTEVVDGENPATTPGASSTVHGQEQVERLEHLTSNLWSRRDPLPSLSLCMGIAMDMLKPNEKHDTTVLRRLLATLPELIAYADALNVWDDRAVVKWMKCLALKRLEDFEGAAAAHRDLRLDIDERRTYIENPLMRARLGGYFRYLYRSNAEVLFALDGGHEEEVFHVVESAKWKILAESSGARPIAAGRHTTRTVPAALESRVLDDLRQALPTVAEGVRYVNFLADEDCTYAVSVAGDGHITTRQIPLGATTLTEVALELQRINDGDPSTFRSKINPRRPEESPYEPVIQALAPLVNWLELDGTELLCVNLPHEVSTVPAQMLQWRGKSLIDCVGVVHAHGAELLSAGARDAALCGPLEEASVFSIPRAGSRGEKEEAPAFARIATAIEQCIPGSGTFEAQRIDRQLLTQSDLTHRLVHFSCHGHFDRDAPLKRSGIFIADRGQLPSTAEQERFILTAEDAAGLQIAGAHVTLSACVCGRSAQIAPGEALGMIWGFLRGRARSVLGACWNTDREATADLMVRFYELWLGGMPKWRALRQAICELKADSRRSHPYFWAPFVLFGHWN